MLFACAYRLWRGYHRLAKLSRAAVYLPSGIRICREFAEKQGYNIANIYSDKARTGTNDSRPDFQHMIKDAASGAFQYIIVYMFDRFARNRRDSIMYKEMLNKITAYGYCRQRNP